MENLISGKEALVALANGELISFRSECDRKIGLAIYLTVNEILNGVCVDGFRILLYKQPK